MALVSARCPDCGAAINMDNGREFCFCSYCGAKVYHEVQRIQMTGTVSLNNAPTVDSLFERATLQLQDREFDVALETCNRILDISPYYAPAYMARYCAKNKLRHITDICYIYNAPLEQDRDIINAMDFADEETKIVYQNILSKSGECRKAYSLASAASSNLMNSIYTAQQNVQLKNSTCKSVRFSLFIVFGILAIIFLFVYPPISISVAVIYLFIFIFAWISQDENARKLYKAIAQYQAELPIWTNEKARIEREFQQAVNK